MPEFFECPAESKPDQEDAPDKPDNGYQIYYGDHGISPLSLIGLQMICMRAKTGVPPEHISVTNFRE